MDAREKLRLYLEQRKELGESELVLDSMTVDEALRTLGAIGKGVSTAGPTPRERATQTGDDWRVLLEANLGAPAVSRKEPEPPPEAPAGLTVDGETDELFNTDIMRLSSLKTIAKAVEACTRCPLYKTATNGVPGEGDPKARLVCVGEAPGANEDETGRRETEIPLPERSRHAVPTS